ncbi:MAG: nucleotidyltransferase family protein [Bacteroidales bacterium]|nr:nucleotidyltransferase family protein [Bacteroidales bacterium]MBR1799432.1 nucleotidyltransferase family protein [Bacteroidales bacterium]
MSTAEDAIYALLRAAATQQIPNMEALQTLDTAAWQQLMTLFQRNHLIVLSASAVEKMPREKRPPRTVYLPWMAERQMAVEWSLHQRKVEQELLSVFADNNIECYTLKGSATASHYPVKNQREYADIDLFIPHNHAVADQIIEQKYGVDISHGSAHHTKYDIHGITIESHYRLFDPYLPPSNKELEPLLTRLIASATFEALHLLRHAAIHFVSGRITLREVCDWAFLLNHRGDDIDWALVSDIVSKFKMHQFASALTTMANRIIETNCPLSTPISNKLQNRFEHDVLYGQGAADEHDKENARRALWKLRRYAINRWKHRFTLSDSSMKMFTSRLFHLIRHPQKLLHKM